MYSSLPLKIQLSHQIWIRKSKLSGVTCALFHCVPCHQNDKTWFQWLGLTDNWYETFRSRHVLWLWYRIQLLLIIDTRALRKGHSLCQQIQFLQSIEWFFMKFWYNESDLIFNTSTKFNRIQPTVTKIFLQCLVTKLIQTSS